MVDDALVMRALNSGIDDYLIKSELNETTLKQAVTKAISRKEKERRLKTLNDRQIAVLRELADTVFRSWSDLGLTQLQLIERFSQGEKTINTVDVVEALNALMEHTARILTELHQALNPTLSDHDRTAFLERVLKTIQAGR